jgi:NAD(P)-dependent dehydrogenase (short-subunit alcohol dehydrogenase family)
MEQQAQVALVTGGGRGIGQAIAGRLLADGLSVAITGRDGGRLEKARRELGERVLALPADVSDRRAVQQVVDRVLQQFGRIDVLVNNAGVGGQRARLWEADLDDWWQVQEVNLRGPMIYAHAVLPGMIERRCGVVINVGSYGALRPLPEGSSYSVSKAALARLSDCLAPEVEEFGIDVFCVSPGLVDTDMTRGLRDVFGGLPASAWNDRSDCAHLISRLVHEDCRALSGRFLHVRDDFDALLAQARRVREQDLYRLGMRNLDGWIE